MAGAKVRFCEATAPVFLVPQGSTIRGQCRNRLLRRRPEGSFPLIGTHSVTWLVARGLRCKRMVRSGHETTFPRAGRAGVLAPGVVTVQSSVTGLCLLVSRDVTSDLGDTTPANRAERVCLLVKQAYLVRWRLLSQVTGTLARASGMNVSKDWVRMTGKLPPGGAGRDVGSWKQGPRQRGSGSGSPCPHAPFLAVQVCSMTLHTAGVSSPSAQMAMPRSPSFSANCSRCWTVTWFWYQTTCRFPLLSV